MMKKKRKKSTIKNLTEDIGHAVSEIIHVKDYVREEMMPKMQAFMDIFEQYVMYKGDMEDFVAFMEENDESKKVTHKKSKTGKKKQATRSGTAKTVSKNGKGSQSGSIQS